MSGGGAEATVELGVGGASVWRPWSGPAGGCAQRTAVPITRQAAAVLATSRAREELPTYVYRRTPRCPAQYGGGHVGAVG